MAKEEKTTSGLSSEFIIHPGETLEEVLSDRNISQKDLALATGVSAKHISEILSFKKDISISFAKKLEYALGIEAQFWINLQSNYDRELYEYKEVHSISKEEQEVINVFKKSGVLENYYKQNLVDKNLAKHVLVLELRRVLGVSNLCDIPKQSYAAAYRIRENVNSNVLFAWQKMCEYKNKDKYLDNPLDINKLKQNIENIKKTMFLEQDVMEEELKKLFAECGIVFDIVNSYKGAPVQGYIKETRNGNLLLCMTTRGKYIDIFWFTLFHEIGHIINNDTKNYLVDFTNEDGKKEYEADLFARDALINHNEYKNFIENENINLNIIVEFAKKCKVDATIVIGRLQNDQIIDHSTYTNCKKKYDWA